jgi:hypothetical protein
VPLAVLPNYPGTREYLPECCSRWHRGGRLSGHRNWHMYLLNLLYDSVRRLYCTESSWIRVLYEIVS